MTNLILNIILPPGLSLVNGSGLTQNVTLSVASMLTPFYASVTQVQLEGGALLNNVAPLTIASRIYQVSKEADAICITPPTTLASITSTGSSSDNMYNMFITARTQWVTCKSALLLLTNAAIVYGRAGSLRLGDLSIQRSRDSTSPIGDQIAALQKQIKYYEVTLRSAGQTMPGGHQHGRMAAKGVNDWQEKTPGRNWVVSGMGANTEAIDPGNATGGRGKPTSFYWSPMYSPPITSYRYGMYPGAFGLSSYSLFNL